MKAVFLHGLDSSSKGTKARWFKERFPGMLIPDFLGPLEDRMRTLAEVLAGRKDLVIVGSSFGGLMATVFVLHNESRVKRLILLAPALNFPDFAEQPLREVNIPAFLYIGRQDSVCPPEIVVPKAERVFKDLSVQLSEDDHLLQKTFPKINWQALLEV